MTDWPALAKALDEFRIHAPNLNAARPVGGGDISNAWCIQTAAGPVFLKTGGAEFSDVFAAEADGLAALQRANAVRVPEVLAVGASRRNSFLALEWLDLGAVSAETDQVLGRQLARLHSKTSDRFGWKRNNTIGRTPQINLWSDNWLSFYRDCRLAFQFDLAARNGFDAELGAAGAQLMDKLPAFFVGYNPQPSLLHGDLWSGNRASVAGEPVVFDPAVYYGDRESDLAMARLFGGFSAAFYSAYEDSWPLAPGHEQRLVIYQLYHVLNHLNLFGHDYLRQACAMIRTALTIVR